MADPESFLKWFDERGIPDARREIEARALDAVANEARLTRWTAAMPAVLQPLWEKSVNRRGDRPDVSPLLQAHARATPGARERVRELFAWFGSISGAWDEYRDREFLTSEMLLSYSPSALFAAADAPLTPAQAEGAARLFAGSDFRHRHPDAREALPAALKAKLLKHCETATDEENRATAHRIFGQ